MESRWPKIQKIAGGFEQRSDFKNEDRLHEEITELPFFDSILSNASFMEGTLCCTISLFGAQNAGKSTFLHSFCSFQKFSLVFLQICQALPILRSTFINARFIDDETSPMDEFPFIDTDVARAMVTVTSDDFIFFCEEFQIKIPKELLEFGELKDPNSLR
eukprot:Trichotokara_eunicae@DN1633_c0_g1_i1.p1